MAATPDSRQPPRAPHPAQLLQTLTSSNCEYEDPHPGRLRYTSAAPACALLAHLLGSRSVFGPLRASKKRPPPPSLRFTAISPESESSCTWPPTKIPSSEIHPRELWNLWKFIGEEKGFAGRTFPSPTPSATGLGAQGFHHCLSTSVFLSPLPQSHPRQASPGGRLQGPPICAQSFKLNLCGGRKNHPSSLPPALGKRLSGRFSSLGLWHCRGASSSL